jgi:hypothetical protein
MTALAGPVSPLPRVFPEPMGAPVEQLSPLRLYGATRKQSRICLHEIFPVIDAKGKAARPGARSHSIRTSRLELGKTDAVSSHVFVISDSD